MPSTVHRAYLGTAAIAASLPFFLDNPQRFKWLAPIIALGAFLVIDDMLFHVTEGKICFLCKILPE